jgi:hypothetical protein
MKCDLLIHSTIPRECIAAALGAKPSIRTTNCGAQRIPTTENERTAESADAAAVAKMIANFTHRSGEPVHLLIQKRIFPDPASLRDVTPSCVHNDSFKSGLVVSSSKSKMPKKERRASSSLYAPGVARHCERWPD